MLNLRGVDLNLLPVLEAAYEERSLSKAADRLSMSQPAVSHALSRLRVMFRDDLFIRHSRGVTPTPVADAIYGRLGDALGLVRSVVSESRTFDPRTSERRFTVAIPHPLGPLLAVRLMDRIKAKAPKISLSFNTRSRPIELQQSLLDGRFDLSLDWLPASHADLDEEALFDDELALVVRKGHPAIGKARTRKAIAASWPLVTLRRRLEGAFHPILDVRQWRNLKPQVALEVSEFLEVLVVARQSDLVGVTLRSLAEAARVIPGIEILDVTPRAEPFPICMAWRASHTTDMAQQFLRDQVRASMREVVKAT